jgi:GR25 family glycosyltransferase involved in LPS biosynthesis|uniref:Glycosyl transferase family 25 domain-containing protein n=1 Tax=viral metagenome TaxID=1070528 RepID=A0A6C0CZD8_9ZZZZ
MSRRVTKKRSNLNKFFDKIFVISLFDKFERWEKVSKQFKSKKIDIERFIAIDGRCSKEGEVGCLQKLKTFEMIYNVTISNKKNYPLKEIVPAASLTIGTILILREMVKRKWSHILICEDDVILSRSLEKKFAEGIKEIGDRKWDLLYLGSGNQTGNNGISFNKNSRNKNLSDIAKFLPIDKDFFVEYKDDLRVPCEELCKPISEHISIAYNPGGTWAYAYSLRGAKKLLRLLDNDAGNHIDKLIGEQTMDGKLKALAFDPPIVWHEGGAIRPDSDIPWEW